MCGQNTFQNKLIDWIIRIILGLAAISCLVPILNTVAISFSSSSRAAEVSLIPKGFNLESYKEILHDEQFFRSFWISIKKVLIGGTLQMALTIFMAYPLSKSRRIFPAHDHYMRVILACMLFSGGTIPWYLVIKWLGLIDTFWALVLPGAVNIGNTIILMNFFKNLPPALGESAAVDGASPLTTLVKIYIPLSLPSIATLTLFSVVGLWNGYFDGMILINNPKNVPLQTYIQSLTVDISDKLQTATPEELLALTKISSLTFNAAKIVVAMIPVMIIYPLLQKYFVTGLVMGAVKE